MSGLEQISSQTSLVLGVSAALTFSGLESSARVTPTPMRGSQSRNRLNEPP